MTHPFHLLEGGEGGVGESAVRALLWPQHPRGSPLAHVTCPKAASLAPLGDTCRGSISESNHDELLGGL